MYILGLNAYHPDSSAALIKDGQVVCAVEEERFNRIKHWSGFPKQSILFCLNKEGIELNNLEFITINTNPLSNFFRKIFYLSTNKFSFNFLKNQLQRRLKKNNIMNDFKKEFNISNLNAKLYKIDHHLSHISSSIFCSPFNEASLLSIDGFGDFSSCLLGYFKNKKLTVYKKINFPHSAGIFYQALTQYIGFTNYGDEYKVMGLSAYGSGRFNDKIQKLITLKNDGTFKLNLKYFKHHKNNIDFNWENDSPKIETLYDKNAIFDLLNIKNRNINDKLNDEYTDLAYSTQFIYEKIFFNLIKSLSKHHQDNNLCLSGGCSLNSLANGKIYKKFNYKKIYMPPASGDAGGSIGSALFKYFQLYNNKKHYHLKNPYLGPSFKNQEVSKIISKNIINNNKFKILNLDYKEISKHIAKKISTGFIVGWFQDSMEFGPRALGNRSILGDPRNPNMKDLLNKKIKRRESFRPFAPSILEDKVSNWFEYEDQVPFMMKIFKVLKEKRKLIPAVVHKDGTGRLQTVDADTNHKYYDLICQFEKITGIPILLNTSFNENEPIVCNPQEALDCFLRTNMDIIVLNNFIIERR